NPKIGRPREEEKAPVQALSRTALFAHLDAHPLFQFVEEQNLRKEGKGPILDAVYGATEGEHNAGEKWSDTARSTES
ncbi:hypothetical protein F4604DRAFT_1792422, partial [Suillus subluteus]